MAASTNDLSGIVDLTFAVKTFSDFMIKCNSSSSDEGHQAYELCKTKCRKLRDKTEQFNLKASGEEIAKQILQEYAQIVLDFTYIDETQLVEEDFPEQTAKTRIRNIFNYFDNILSVAKKTFPDVEPADTLGVEIFEVILWRKGALLYMYCHQVIPDKKRVKRYSQEFRQDLYDGISYLKQMLNVRGSDHKELSWCELQTDDTLQLIKSGIYTDTHLLAMMYCGEMCYWFCESVQEGLFDTMPDFPVNDIGSCLLNCYIKAVQGPLKGAGWSCDRAEELLTKMTKASY